MLKNMFQVIAIISITLLAACSFGGGYESGVQDDTAASSENEKIIIGEEEQLILNDAILIVQGAAEERQIIWKLDVNLDGKEETITLEGLDSDKNLAYYDTLQNYRIQVGESSLEVYGDNVAFELAAFSPDGKIILLAIYDDGPSADPITRFYCYDGDELLEAGSISADIRTIEMPIEEKSPFDGVYREEDGTFKATFRADLIQTQWAWGYWFWNGEAMVMREDTEYECVSYEGEYGWLTLLEPLEVYATMSENENPIIMSPQQVQCTRMGAEEWIYLEAEDGTAGWLRLESGSIPSLGEKFPWEVFEGLYLAD